MSHPAIPIPDPRGYVDYRLFLADAIFARWGQIEDGAHLDFAQTASCTESHIVNILEGRRNLQDELIDGFATALELEGDRRTAFLLLVQRADPASVVDPEELELELMALRADWVDERDQEAVRVVPVPVEPHPSVAVYRQDEHSAVPDPAVAVGLLEALALIKATGKLKRDYRYGLWTIPRAGMAGLVAILDAGASDMQVYFHQCAAEGSPLARRYAWQAQLALATEPVPEGEEAAAPRTIAAPKAEPTPEPEAVAAPEEDQEDAGDPAGTPPSVFDFLSDHLYLEAWVAARKVKVPGFTVGRLAVRSQASASYLYQILSGKRVPDKPTTEALSHQLGHTPADRLHYMRLVRLRHAESDVEVEETLWQIVAALVKRAEAPSRAVAWTLLGLPALGCMLQMVRLDDFREDPRWIGRRVNLSPRRATIGLAFLEQAGLVARDKGGRLRAVEATVRSRGPDAKLAARFFRLYLLAAQRAAPRNWRPHLFWKVEGPLSASQAQELMVRAAAIDSRLQKAFFELERSDATAKDRVVQTQYQVFPQLPLKPRRRRKKKPSGE